MRGKLQFWEENSGKLRELSALVHVEKFVKIDISLNEKAEGIH